MSKSGTTGVVGRWQTKWLGLTRVSFPASHSPRLHFPSPGNVWKIKEYTGCPHSWSVAFWILCRFPFDSVSPAKPRQQISIRLDDGRVETGSSWETTPADVAKSIAKNLFDKSIVAVVNDQLWDLHRPLENDCSLRLLDFDNAEGACTMLLVSSFTHSRLCIVRP